VRDALLARGERVVRENRFTIAVVFPAVGATTLVASAAGLLPPLLAYNPLLVLVGTLVMRLPLAAALGPLLDRRAVGVLSMLVAYTYAIEAVGLATGFPYGEFRYLADVGPMVEGVPVALPLFFVPLALNSYLLATLLLGPGRRGGLFLLPLALGLLLVVDLVLDPAAVAIGFWTYDGGPYYGVPVSNYFGWALSGGVAVGLVDAAFDRRAILARLEACPFALDDMVSFTLLWGVINVAAGNWIPVGLALGLVAALAHTERFDLATPALADLGGS
jgi:putative membrane protein